MDNKAHHSQVIPNMDEGDIEIPAGIQSVKYIRDEKRIEIVQIVKHNPQEMVMRTTPHVIYKHVFNILGSELHYVERIQGTYIPSRAESYSFPEGDK